MKGKLANENGSTERVDRLELASKDVTEANIDEFLRLFPEARTEGRKVDFDRLRRLLGESVDVAKERYGMNWPGKANCFKTIQQPSLGALLPLPGESIAWEQTANLVLEGDNLEILKLLQKSYLGKVKMIYIDPPYNTGKDFIYPDNWTETLQTYLAYTGQVDQEGIRFSTNVETDGRFHSKWLNMMYPRLHLARNFLREDGVIFISIDDHEAPNLRKICDEVFGEENFLAQFSWRTDGNFDNQAKIKECHEYVVAYARNAELFPHPPVVDPSVPRDSKLFRPEIRNTIVKNGPKNPVSEVQLPAGFPSERRSGELGPRNDAWPHYLGKAVFEKNVLAFPVTVKSGWSSKALLLEFASGGFKPVNDGKGQETRFIISTTGAIEAIKTRTDRQSHVISSLNGFGGSQKASAQLEELGVPFEDYPKPVDLIRYFVQMNEGTDFLAMDFFAGSGTTAEAVLSLNASDGGRRNFILVQLPEPLNPENSKQASAHAFCKSIGKPPTISEICKERVRRSIKKLNDLEKGKLPRAGAEPDRGFRAYRLAESNFRAWDADAPKDPDALQRQLVDHVYHIRKGRTAEDILAEILLKSGFPLTTSVETLEIGGKKLHSIAGGALLICLDRNLTLELIRAMADRKPERVVCLDAGFAGNDQLKANAVQTFKAKGVASFKTI